MAADEKLKSERESTERCGLRELAFRATSVFAIPPDVERLFAPLAEVIAKVSAPFNEIGKVLRANIEGLLSVVSMPYTLAYRSAVNSHWQRIHSAARIRSLMLEAKPDETKEESESRRERVAVANADPQMDHFVHSAEGRNALIGDTLGFLERLRADESLAGAANELILQGLVLCWGAFEVLARDCFIAHLNANPGCSLTLFADSVAKRRFELSKFSLETLATHNFNLSARMGTLLAQQQDLSDVYSVKAIYQALFPHNKKLSDALSDPDLRLLSLRRNVIVHQRGLIDDTYAASTACVQQIGDRLKLAPDDLELHLGTTIKTAIGILEAVSP